MKQLLLNLLILQTFLVKKSEGGHFLIETDDKSSDLPSSDADSNADSNADINQVQVQTHGQIENLIIKKHCPWVC